VVNLGMPVVSTRRRHTRADGCTAVMMMSGYTTTKPRARWAITGRWVVSS